MDTVIHRILVELGVPLHIQGYDYLATAIRIAVTDPSTMDRMTKVFYPRVAAVHDTSGSCAERSIRHGIECSFDRCDRDVLAEYFGGTISPTKGKPTNSEFIARIAAVVRERMEGF